MHPTTLLTCRTLLPDVFSHHALKSQDTARAVTNLLFTGTLADSRTFGSSLPTRAATCRCCWVTCTNMLPSRIAEKAPNGIEYELKPPLLRYRRYRLWTNDCSTQEHGPNHTDPFWQRRSFRALAETAEGMMQLGFSADDASRASAATMRGLCCLGSKQIELVRVAPRVGRIVGQLDGWPISRFSRRAPIGFLSGSKSTGVPHFSRFSRSGRQESWPSGQSVDKRDISPLTQVRSSSYR